ncbi:MAG TPA: hypothetical protein VG325_17320 [Solirubrobacteraceae bacterium]|nr:hypothetical protein [Solirubrobacteraceae bacterium]
MTALGLLAALEPVELLEPDELEPAVLEEPDPLEPVVAPELVVAPEPVVAPELDPVALAEPVPLEAVAAFAATVVVLRESAGSFPVTRTTAISAQSTRNSAAE